MSGCSTNTHRGGVRAAEAPQRTKAQAQKARPASSVWFGRQSMSCRKCWKQFGKGRLLPSESGSRYHERSRGSAERFRGWGRRFVLTPTLAVTASRICGPSAMATPARPSRYPGVSGPHWPSRRSRPCRGRGCRARHSLVDGEVRAGRTERPKARESSGSCRHQLAQAGGRRLKMRLRRH